MGARSYIVRGKGNADSFESGSHRAATIDVECRKDKDVIDETPAPRLTWL